jgi:cytochrome c oxidase subunit 2
MRMLGLKSILLAAGLALAGAGQAAPTVPAVPAPSVQVAPAPDAAAVPDTTAAPAAAAPVATADPLVDAKGVPLQGPTPGIGMGVAEHYEIQPQVTPNGRDAQWFHNVILLPLITIISLFVLALLAYVVVRFRRARNPVPSRTSHNTFIEIVWTGLPVLILAGIAIPSIKLLAHQYAPPPANAVTLKAIGNQWFWSYEYPDHGGISLTANMLKEQSEVEPGKRYRTDVDGPRLLATDTRVVLPVGVPIRLISTANDVIHSWAMPAFWIKLDAVPGRLNETSFTIEKPGVYYGQCSELCGARHAYMPIVVEAVSPAVFAQWVAAKGGTMPGTKPAAAAAPLGAPAPDAGANVTGPVENVTVAPATSNQAATANPAGAGNVDQ